MKLRPYAVALAAVVAGCSALDGLTGGEDNPAPPAAPAPPVCTAPGAPKCEHGRCAEASGAATCACDTGWTGPTCGECAIGGACDAPTCAATKCAAHSTCDDSAGAPSCKCVVGYGQTGTDCAWRGAVADPTFENKPPGAWEVAGGVTIDATAPGVKDPGIAELRTATCSTASVKQSFMMPPVESAEPLAMEIFGKGKCEIPFFPTSLTLPCFRPISLSIAGRGVEPIPFFFGDGSAPNRLCLGERAFGGAITTELFSTSCTSLTKSITLDHLDVVAAPECPLPGQVPNGDFEGPGGWAVAGTGAEVAAGVGNQSSRGGRLHSVKRCDAPRLTGALSVRLAQPTKPALSFTVKGTLNRRMRVYVNNYAVGTLTGTAVYEKVSLCMPEHLKGMAGTLSFALEDDLPTGACGDPDDYEFDFDDLKLETDATCDDPAQIIDGGFERKDVARYWSKTENGGSVSFARNAARTGTGHLVVSQSACSKSTSVRTVTSAHERSPGKGGPAVEFFYKATTAAAITYSGPGGALAPVADWTKARMCIPGRRSGFPTTIDFVASAAADCAAGSLSVDDVRAVLDPTCPE